MSANYYSGHQSIQFPEKKQLITYSFNNKESTIVGFLDEKEYFINLYEYRGKYVGLEFLISFSKQSTSYKLIKVSDAAV